MKLFTKLNDSDRGASMVEYGLIVAVISMMSVSAVTLLGDSTEETFETVAEAMDTGQTSDGGSVSSTAQDDSGDEADSDSDTSGGSAADDAQDDSQDDAGYEEQSDDNSQVEDDEQGSDDDAQESDDSQPEDSDDEAAQPEEQDGSDDDDQDSDDSGSEDAESDDTDDENDSSTNSGEGDTADDQSDSGDKGSKANPTKTASSFTWWNDNKHGGQGEWKASVTFENDWIRHQYLTLEVTTVDHKGKTKTTQVDSFYVPASGSTTFHHWGNFMKDHKGKVRGVMEVHVDVVSVKTSDEGWKPVSFPQEDGATATVEAPPIP